MGDLTDGHKHTFFTETMLAVSQIRVAEFIQILFGVFRNCSWPIDVILDHPKRGHPCKNVGVVTRAMGDKRVTKKHMVGPSAEMYFRDGAGPVPNAVRSGLDPVRSGLRF